MTENTIVVVSDPRFNHWREYHLGVRISHSLIERLHPEIVTDDKAFYRNQLGELGWSLMDALHSVPGVVEMCFCTHSFTLYSEENVDWKVLGPRVIDLVKLVLRIEKLEVEEILYKDISPQHFHEDDSARPNFVMPQ